MYHSFEIHTQMGENMKKIVFALALVAVISVCSTASISAEEEERSRFHFRTINFPNDTFTQLLGINDEEMIAGYHGAATNVGFVFSSRNSFTLENFPNAAQTQVIGINNQGYTDGFYIDAAGINHGFLDINGTFTTVDFPGTKLNQLLGLNNLEQAAGYYADAAGIDHPYIVLCDHHPGSHRRRTSHWHQRQWVDLRFLHR
jgi:hypothetical protein